MLRIRLIEETIALRYSEWKMRCPTHLCIGQEAVSAAVGMVLRKDDFVLSTHRSHGHYLGKGGDLNTNDSGDIWQSNRVHRGERGFHASDR